MTNEMKIALDYLEAAHKYIFGSEDDYVTLNYLEALWDQMEQDIKDQVSRIVRELAEKINKEIQTNA